MSLLGTTTVSPDGVGDLHLNAVNTIDAVDEEDQDEDESDLKGQLDKLWTQVEGRMYFETVL